ncbi:MAG: CoA transferase [Kineosporiaceae bacterium]|nr:CoA transferase [Aeromicrobium sp.]
MDGHNRRTRRPTHEVGSVHRRLLAGFETTRTHHSAHPSVVPFQACEAADGWLVIAAPKEKFWTRLTEILGDAELATNPQFRTLADRQSNSSEVIAIIETVIAALTVAHRVELLSAAAIPCEPVHSVADALNDPRVDARHMILEADHPLDGRIKTIASPVKMGNETLAPTPAPQRGEHTESVLREWAKLDTEAIDRARVGGALGSLAADAGTP